MWKDILDITYYRAKLIRVQRQINIRILKPYLTVSIETLCVIKGLVLIKIKTEETAKYYEIVRRQEKLFHLEMDFKNLDITSKYN